MKALKASIKPFEAPQTSVKKKFDVIFSLRPGLGREGLIIEAKLVDLGLISYHLAKKKKKVQALPWLDWLDCISNCPQQGVSSKLLTSLKYWNITVGPFSTSVPLI